jgi:hypothetical protein
MTKRLLLAMMIVFVVSEAVAAQVSIIKRYQNDLADSGVIGGGSGQNGPLKLAMGPVSAPQLPSGSPNKPPAPSSGCSSSGNPCTNRHVKTPNRHRHSQ